MVRALPILALLLLLPLAWAQPAEGTDAHITIAAGAAPVVDAPPGLVQVNDPKPGERYAFDLTLTKDYTTFEVRASGLDITSPRQLVPMLVVPDDEYPLFEQFPNERIWDVDGTGNVFFVNGTADDVVLRLGVAGPRNVTLVLTRDVTPPTFTLGEVQELTPIGFYQETTTNELAIADLQVRKAGSDEWIQNPTPLFHFRQRFPIQGLTPDADHEARVLFHDWAGNTVTSDVYTVRTPPKPVFAAPTITPLSPEPNATLPAGNVVIQARVESVSDVSRDGVRLFFDKREVTPEVDFRDGVVTYVPNVALAPGRHTVAIEVTTAEGGEGLARWNFDIEGAATRDTPLGAWLVVAALGLMAFARRT